jgi:hypothetical protein
MTKQEALKHAFDLRGIDPSQFEDMCREGFETLIPAIELAMDVYLFHKLKEIAPKIPKNT